MDKKRQMRLQKRLYCRQFNHQIKVLATINQQKPTQTTPYAPLVSSANFKRFSLDGTIRTNGGL